jgi:hypothetical protein
MTPDLLEIYIAQVIKMSQAQITDAVNALGVVCTQDQISRTCSGERRNERLRGPIEQVIQRPGAFDDEFDAIADLRWGRAPVAVGGGE